MTEQDILIDKDVEKERDTEREPPWRVLIHNDNVTPFDFVILILRHVFKLSGELAEHITWEAHTRGVASVVTRPKTEALRLIAEAHAAARANGFPLTFTAEPKEG